MGGLEEHLCRHQRVIGFACAHCIGCLKNKHARVTLVRFPFNPQSATFKYVFKKSAWRILVGATWGVGASLKELDGR